MGTVIPLMEKSTGWAAELITVETGIFFLELLGGLLTQTGAVSFYSGTLFLKLICALSVGSGRE